MSHKNDGKRYKNCTSGRDFTCKVECHPDLVESHWTGDHLIGRGPDGDFTISAGRYEFPKYIRNKIIKELIAIGLGIVIIAFAIRMFI